MTTTPESVPRAEPIESLLTPLLPGAYGLAYRLTRNAADAEDVLQDASLLAFRRYETFQPGTHFKAWFYRILTNCFYARCRVAKRRPQTVDLEHAPPFYLLTRSVEEGWVRIPEDPAREAIDRVGVETIERAIVELPEEYRAVVTLYLLEDHSYQEIAELLGCPVGTVRSRLHRGRRMLQKALWHLAAESNTGTTSPVAEGGVR